MGFDASKLKRVELVDETDHFLLVNKPCGLAVHGGAEQSGRTLIDILQLASEEPKNLFLVHRLDRATSGLILVAKSSEQAKALGENWSSVKKTYLALVFGGWEGPSQITSPIDGKQARTLVLHAQPIANGAYSLLVLQLETGRTHQIRRHLFGLGHPVVMDDKYGHFSANKDFRRELRTRGLSWPKKALFLHAYGLQLAESRGAWCAAPPQIWFDVLSEFGLEDADLVLKPKLA